MTLTKYTSMTVVVEQNLMAKTRRKQLWFILSFSVFFTGLLIIIYTVSSLPEFNQYNVVKNYRSEKKISTTRTILLWNKFFGQKRWGLPEDTMGPDYFRDEIKCPVFNCELTNEQNFLPRLDLYDAVVFHTAEAFPLINSVPAQRSVNQFYVFAIMEPPGETKHKLSDENGFYNLTMTYRLDSDIVWSYDCIVDNENDVCIAAGSNHKWRTPPKEFNDTTIFNSWQNKTKMAAWFVSHCKTLSQRETLAKELQKYIDVDIFGKCGPLSCKYTSEECDRMLDEEYKFYFSFENSLCSDYVTEKLYNALKRNVIPVVFGGADYKKFIPPRSYINAEDFETVEELANYLKYLSQHPEEYSKYFWWRRYYHVGFRSPFCDLCEKLHSSNYQHKSQFYNNIEDWWLGGSCRFKPKIKF